ncbi:hypothetical protein ACQZV8_18835 [Magnetococcales bacterium HHB-1]
MVIQLQLFDSATLGPQPNTCICCQKPGAWCEDLKKVLCSDCWIDGRLAEWGSWARGSIGQGYPQKTMIARMMQGDFSFSQGQDGNSRIDEIEKHLLRLKWWREDQYKVLIVQYIYHKEGGRRKAEALKIPRTSFRALLAQGRCFIAGALGPNEKKSCQVGAQKVCYGT